MRTMSFGTWILVMGLLNGCGAESESTGTALRMALKDVDEGAVMDGDPAVVEDADGAAVTLDGAEAYVRDIELDLPEGRSCADLADFEFVPPVSCSEDVLRIEGPFRFDLFTGLATPSLEDIIIPSGRYARVDVRFEPADAEDGLVTSSEPLAGQSMVAHGSFDADGTEMPYSLRLAFNEDARFETPEGIAVGEDAGALLLLLDPTQWFATLPLARCHADGDLTTEDGTVLVEDTQGSCSDIENALKESIKNSGQLGGA